MNKTILFCNDWEFSKCPIDTEYTETLDFERVDIPHDWLISQVSKDLYETSTGWYRKRFDVAPEALSDGRRISLRFDGIYMDSRIYINGIQVFEWKYGYSTFECDITDALHPGENEVRVRVDYRCPNTRWYSGAGIFRNVYINYRENAYILPDGVYITADGSGNAKITAECARPADKDVKDYTVRAKVIKGDREYACAVRPMCAAFTESIPEAVRSFCRNDVKFSVNGFEFRIDDTEKWDIASPVLYTAEVTLFRGDESVHTERVRFGFRDMSFEPEKGFLLNGRKVKLHGVCEHHDNGALGAAFNRNAFRRKLTILRGMGVNALRTTHNMPDPAVMELCDEMGFIVVAEAFDMWELPKTDNDYHRFFKDWLPADVASWVRRDRNHACLAAWSIGNEIYDTHESEHGQEITSRLVWLVRQHDPRCNAHVTIGSNYMAWDNAQKCADIVKLAGYNYSERLYKDHHAKYPDWIIYGSETASTLQSRGIYQFPYSKQVLTDDDKQCSSLGNCSTGWGAKNSEYNITMDRDTEFSAGQFIWTGFDYIGEPTPYDTKNSYFGQFDTCGFPKDSSYIYKGEWTDPSDKPFVHIFPYWDHTEGAEIDVRVASNAPRIVLYFRPFEKDGETVSEQFKAAEKTIDHQHDKVLTLNTVITYTKGELIALALDENGNEIARDVQRSFGDTASLAAIPDKTELRADGTDLIYIGIDAVDKDGNFVANANNRVFVEVTGAGRLIGLDNGDSNDFDEYKGTSRRLFSGKMLAVIAAKDIAGDISVKISSPSLPDKTLVLRAMECEYPAGTSCIMENKPMKTEVSDPENDIPIRKIELLASCRKFTADAKELGFKVKIYPENTTVTDIRYEITNPVGIISNLAEITYSDNETVKILCKGDGEFYLRALTDNGVGHCRLISVLRLTSEGIGSAVFDPYGFITGGLYDIGSDNITNGIEKGASFGDGESWFGFANVDFGRIGSDTLTIPIYSNNNRPVYLDIFDGAPDSGKLLANIKYDIPPKWLTYQPITVKLPEKMKGIRTISFRASERYAVKGFSFEAVPKEFSEISAADHDNIYGDRFTVAQDAVTGIGNNVVLDFGEFDFTETAPSALAITGRSALPINSIHLTVKDENGDTDRILCEFAQADDYTERIYPVNSVKGKVNISFTFLPGSDFDLRSFRFIK